MKVIVAGSRSITDGCLVDWAIVESSFEITELVSGGARGVDSLGEMWADRHNIPIRRFIPNWDLYGKSAGFLRNTEMTKYAEALIAIHDGKSRGTADMIQKAVGTGLKVFVKTDNPELF